jgi:hypothetical protein
MSRAWIDRILEQSIDRVLSELKTTIVGGVILYMYMYVLISDVHRFQSVQERGLVNVRRLGKS